MMRNMKGKIFWLVRATRRVVEYRLEGERAGVVVDLLGLAPAQAERADKAEQQSKNTFFHPSTSCSIAYLQHIIKG